MNLSESPLLTVPEVIKITQSSRMSVYRWVQSNKLKSVKFRSGGIRIAIGDLADFLGMSLDDLKALIK